MSHRLPDEPTEHFGTPQPGVVWFDRFEFVRMLGRGGVGSVWEVKDRVLEERVALKVLPEVLRWDEAGMRRIRNEVRRTRELHHPNIVRLHDLHVGEAGLAIAMELVTGRTLSTWRLGLSEELAAPEDILRWLPDLASALDYAHGQGVVHRDIKPANLILSEKGVIKVTDFGVAAQTTETLARVSTVASGGTLVYMSPQQLWGELSCTGDDVYGVGATLYELLAGEPPFLRGDLFTQVVHRTPMLINRKREALGSSSRIPLYWEEAIAGCLAKKVEDRPSSVGELVGQLSGNGVKSRRAAKAFGVVRSRHRDWLRWGLLAAGAVGLALWLRLGSDNNFASSGEGEIGEVAKTTSNLIAGKESGTGSDSRAKEAGLPGSRFVYGSMAVEMVCQFPFDGSTVNMVGNLPQATQSRVAWVPDRFGREEAAARIGWGSLITYPLEEDFAVDGRHKLTVAGWVRADGNSGQFLELRPIDQGALGLSVALNRGVLMAGLRGYWGDDGVEVATILPTSHDEWFHFAVAVDDLAVTLYLNGQEQGTRTIERALPLSISPHYSLILGHDQHSLTSVSDFVLDDLRIWRRTLDDEVVLSLWLEDDPPIAPIVHTAEFQWPWEQDHVYRSTEAQYAADDDRRAMVRAELGEVAEVADWDQLKIDAGPWPQLWAEMSGFYRDSRMVTRGGEFSFTDKRQYEVTRMPGGIPRFFLAHAYVGEQELALGSWTSTPPILATVPSTGKFTVRKLGSGQSDKTRWTEERANIWRLDHELPPSGSVSSGGSPVDVVRRHWVVELSSMADEVTAIRLALGSGIQVMLTSTKGRQWEIAYAGDTQGSRVSRNFVLSALPHRWIIVESEGRIFQMIAESKRNTIQQRLVIDPVSTSDVRDSAWTLTLESAKPLPSLEQLPTVIYAVENP
ncbi:protein kinase domain-containing protein [Actomonas aquatica]|uniref:Protein kinase n=1 Tax=Actomonas aquatica TaxID=2866162 RepID=A0ABZ1C3D6_9BACT|nr:protein kinase [Opitutus sp. WL0086]WRQ85733.1 protein kinase [Opitutus sp. WL0086]